MNFLLAWGSGPLMMAIGAIMFRKGVAKRIEAKAQGMTEETFSRGNKGVPNMTYSESVAVFGGLTFFFGFVMFMIPIVLLALVAYDCSMSAHLAR